MGILKSCTSEDCNLIKLHFSQFIEPSARLACVFNLSSQYECSVCLSVVLSLQFNNLGPESCIILRDLLLDPNSSVRSLQ